MRFLALAIMSTIAVLPLRSPAQIQSKEEYPVCQTGHAFVGEVPNLPFTARVEEGLRRIGPDGKTVRVDDKPDSPAGLIVRDGNGRVIISSRITTTHAAEGDVSEWSETICDPARGTVTDLTYRVTEPSSGLRATSADGADAYIADGAEGTGLTRVQKGHSTRTFVCWHNVVEGRDNLGPEILDGIPAYRYRLTRTRREHSIHDVVLSDQLFLQLADTTWKRYPEVEDEIHLIGIHLGEPLPALFEIAPAVRAHVMTSP